MYIYIYHILYICCILPGLGGGSSSSGAKGAKGSWDFNPWSNGMSPRNSSCDSKGV